MKTTDFKTVFERKKELKPNDFYDIIIDSAKKLQDYPHKIVRIKTES